MKTFKVRIVSVPSNLALACGAAITERIIPVWAESRRKAVLIAESLASQEQATGVSLIAPKGGFREADLREVERLRVLELSV